MLHVVLGDLIDCGILNEPLAELERSIDDARLIYQHILCHLKTRVNHAWLHNCVFDQIFAIDD